MTSGEDVYTEPITAYHASSTIVGWSSFTVKEIYYKRTGKTVDVWFNLAGTPNSATTSFTLPYNASTLTITIPVAASEASTPIAGPIAYFPVSGNVVTIYKDINGTTWNAGAANRDVRGYFRYEMA